MPRPSRITQTHRRFQQELAALCALPEHEINPNQSLEALIPKGQRRQVWKQLQEAGLDLPDLVLSNKIFWVATAAVLAPVLLLVSLLSWTCAFSLIELIMTARRVTRPLAVYPPAGCQSVQEAVLRLTRFHMSDYRNGLWSKEDIAIKVRSIISYSLGLPLEKVTPQTRLLDLCS